MQSSQLGGVHSRVGSCDFGAYVRLVQSSQLAELAIAIFGGECRLGGKQIQSKAGKLDSIHSWQLRPSGENLGLVQSLQFERGSTHSWQLRPWRWVQVAKTIHRGRQKRASYIKNDHHATGCKKQLS